MSVSIGTLIGYLQLQDNLSPALKIAQANVGTAAKGLDKLGGTAEKLGRDMLPMSAAIAAAGVAIFKFGKDFEKTMTQIQTLAGGSADQVVMYKAAVMDMVHEVGKSPQELGEALYFITSSGQSGAQALDTLRVSAKASALGLGETKTVADAATSAVNAYGKENISSAEAVRVLVATVREGKGEADALAGSFGRVIPIAAEMGVRFQDLGAFMAATTKIGLSAEESATALRGALTTISAPTKEQTAAFADLAERGLLPLGFNLENIRKKIRDEGLAQGFMQLTEATRGNSEALTAIIGNVRAATGVLGAYGKQGQETLRIQAKMRTDLKEVDEGFKTLSQTVDQQWNQMLANMQANAVNAFDAIKPAFHGFMTGGLEVTETIDAMIRGFKQLPQSMQTGLVGLATLGAVIGPGLLVAGAAMKAFSGSLTLVAGALGTTAGLGPVVVGALSLIGQAALVVGTAIASWKLGTAIADTKLFGEEQMSLGESFSYGLLKIEQWTGVLDASDADIENSILAQRGLKTEVTAAAGAFDIATASAEGYAECVAQMATPQEQAKNMTAMWTKEMSELQAQVAALTTEQRTAIQTGLEMEKSTGDIATGLGITEASVKAYAHSFEEANKKVDAFIEGQRKSTEETRRLAEELKQGAAHLAGTEQDAKMADIDAWFNAEVMAIEGVGDVYDKHYATLAAMRDQKKQAELTAISEVSGASLQALEQDAAKQEQTYSDLLGSDLTYNRATLENQREKWRAAEERVRAFGSAASDTMASVADAGRKAAEITTDAWMRGVVAISTSGEELFRALGGQLETFAERAQRQLQGASMDIHPLTKTQIADVQSKMDLHGALTGADPTEALRRKLAQLEKLEGTYAPKSAAQYRSMIDDQTLLSQLRMMDLGAPMTSSRVLGGTTQPSGGIPSETTRSVSGTGGGGVTGVINNYINGTGEQVAKVVSDQLMNTLRVGRQFGSA